MRSQGTTAESDWFHHRICAGLPKEMWANCFLYVQVQSFGKLSFGQSWAARYRLGVKVGRSIEELCSTKLVVQGATELLMALQTMIPAAFDCLNQD